MLAVIVGIGPTLFDEFRTVYGGTQPSIEDALSTALTSPCLLGLGIMRRVQPSCPFGRAVSANWRFNMADISSKDLRRFGCSARPRP